MSVGPIHAHEAILCGHVTLTLTDGEGNVKAVRQEPNLISTIAKQIMASCAHAGGAGVNALYVYICSAMNGTPTASMGAAFSGYGHYSINVTNIPHTLTWSVMTSGYQWSLNGTMTFVGYGGYSSIDAAAILWTPTYAASLSTTQWWAQACFTDLAINSVDRLSFNWAFSLSTTTSTAV